MSTHTTSDLPNKSLGPSLTQNSSPNKRRKNSALRSISDPTPPTRTPWLLLLPSKSWIESNFNSQTFNRSQCPCMHYHPWCNNCQTLMGWEPPQPIKPKSTKSIPPFGDRKTVVQVRSCYWSPFMTQIKAQNVLKKVCLMWRDKQFTKAIVKRSGQLAAQEALHRQACQQHMAHGAAPRV